MGQGSGAAGPDLSFCELEPIHMPGAIQPHGAVVVALADRLVVSHASANLDAIIGVRAEVALGRPLHAVLGNSVSDTLGRAGMLEGLSDGQALILSTPDHRNLDLRAHRSGRYICMDIEPIRAEPQQKPPVTLVQSVLETFKYATTGVELCELAVAGLRAITGFDRVMAYRFHADGHGEVIAEARIAALEPYLGLHYPASDVPPQARRLYMRQRVGTIADSSYQPVQLLGDPSLSNGVAVDLTHSALRSASPIHREYMRNMKTAASMTIGLVHAGTSNWPKLWGMLVCHNTKPKIAGPELRAVADMIGQVVSLLLGSLSDAERSSQQFERQKMLNELANRLTGAMPLSEALIAEDQGLLQVVGAAGAIVRIDGAMHRVGQTPPRPAAEDAIALLQPLAGGALLAIDDLGTRYPELADCTEYGSGALLLPLGHDSEDAILWFRPELPRTVAWGGNPNQHVIADPATGRLSPRASFTAWREVVSGRSEPWAEVDCALARQLRTAFEHAAAQRTKAELAKLRHYDALTGLPNRRLLQQRLAEAQNDTSTVTALLFLDIDRFKAVNDTMGHAAGDALLIEVARRLVDIAGPDHVTARLGGDEFVILCRGLDRDALTDLSERVRAAIEISYDIIGRPCYVSASIGIAIADQLGGLDLVCAADTAMYAAKQGGGNRGVVFGPSLSEQAHGHAALDIDMREALSAGDQFTLLYQPLFRITNGARRLVGFEALLRWQHPRHGRMIPCQFIPQAEQSGMILPLGEWVLAQAVRQGRAFQLIRPDAEMRIAVNVSPSQIPQPGFCSGLAGALEAEAFPPTALFLEVTDSILANVAATSMLAEIRKLGVRVVIDDFGIGHSSHRFLRSLQADEVKLDHRFFGEATGDMFGGVLGAVIALAHAACMPVAFEGIETQSEADIALGAGADIVQGFFFAPPLSASAAEDLVAHYQQSEARRGLGAISR